MSRIDSLLDVSYSWTASSHIMCSLSRIPAVGEWAWYHEDFIRGQTIFSKIKMRPRQPNNPPIIIPNSNLMTLRLQISVEEARASIANTNRGVEIKDMQNQYPKTLSVSATVSDGSPALADSAVGDSIAGLDQLAAAIEDEDEDNIDQPSTNNAAQNGDVCIEHGAKKVKANVKKRKTCNHEGCTNLSKQRGLCTRHYKLSNEGLMQQDTLWM